MKLEKGGLAIIIHRLAGLNSGKIVELKEYLPSGDHLINGFRWSAREPSWYCEAKGSPIVDEMGNAFFEASIIEAILRPISGIPDTEEENKEKELEK